MPRSATRSYVLRYRGTPVEIQNYIDDTGVRVTDVIVGFREIASRAWRRSATSPSTRFDYCCWDLYSQVTEWYDEDKARLEIRARALRPRTWQQRDVRMGGSSSTASFAHLQTMARLNIGYDLLTYEGDILRLKFWAHALETS